MECVVSLRDGRLGEGCLYGLEEGGERGGFHKNYGNKRMNKFKLKIYSSIQVKQTSSEKHKEKLILV